MARRVLGDLVHHEVRSGPLTLRGGSIRVALWLSLLLTPATGDAMRDGFGWLDVQGGDPALIERVDLQGEEFAGESYAWTGAGPIEHVFRVDDRVPGTTVLWLRWGGKGDRRTARLLVGDRELTLARSSDDGFAWWPLVVPPEWWTSEGTLRVSLRALEGPGPHAFLSEMRLRRVAELRAPKSAHRLIEAEAFDGPWRVQQNVPGYSGSGFRVSNASGIAERPLTTTVTLNPGVTYCWVRAYEGDGQDRRFALAIDDVEMPVTHHETSGRGFTWRLAGSVTVGTLPIELEVRDRGPGFEVVDAVWLVQDAFFDPGLVDRVRRGPPDEAPTSLVERLIAETSASAEAAHARIRAEQTDADRWRGYQPALRRRLREALGLEPFPERTDLKVRSVGMVERDGYRIEKIIFESRPGFEVPANVYVPAGRGPEERLPTVLNPVGHWGRSKAEPVVQARCIGLAKLGYIALTYDAFGQGERAIDGNGHGEYHRSVLVGRNNMTYMVWDSIRALDYLLTRADVDPDRIACTGASGGGLNTLYAAAIDERIQVAVPVVFVTRIREFLETGIGHCPCSHVNGLARFADMGDVAGLIAPRPQMLITATHDPSFTPAGARAAEEQARGAYRALEVEERLALHEFEAGHDYNRPMREALYRFLALHLRGESSPVEEPDLQVETDASVLSCYPSGRQPASTITVRMLGRQALEEALREPPPAASNAWEDTVRSGRDIRPAVRRSDLGGESWRALEQRLGLLDSSSTRARWATETGIELTVDRWVGAEPEGPVILWLAGTTELDPAAVTASSACLVVSGLLEVDGSRRHLAVTDSHLLGDPLPLRQARAIASAILGLRAAAPDSERPWILVAPERATAWPALLAGTLVDGIGGLVLSGLPTSWREAFSAPAVDLAIWRAADLGDVKAWTDHLRCPWRSWDREAPLTECLDFGERRRRR